MLQSIEVARRDPARAPSTQAPVFKPGRFVVGEDGMKAGDVVQMARVPAGVTVLQVDLVASIPVPGMAVVAVGDEGLTGRYIETSFVETAGGRVASNRGTSIHDVTEAGTIDLTLVSGELPAGTRLAILVCYIASSS